MAVAAVEAWPLREALLSQRLPGFEDELSVGDLAVRLGEDGLDGIAESPISVTSIPGRIEVGRRLVGLAAADEDPHVRECPLTA